MKKLNLGCGKDVRSDWINVDITPLPGVDIVGDISDPRTFDSLPDNSVIAIEMSHILEHIPNPLPMLEALHRVAMDGCRLHIAVPHGANDMAFADPQHVRQYFPSSFQFFAQPAYKRADYGYRGDWDTTVVTILVDPQIPDEIPDEQILQLLNTSRNIAWEMQAILTAVKPARDPSTRWDFNPDMYIRKAR